MDEPSDSPPPTPWLKLLRCQHLSPRILVELLQHYPDPARLLGTGPGELERLTPRARRVAAALHAVRGSDVSAELAWLAEPDHHLLTIADPRYPPQLKEIPDPPVALFVAGDACLLSAPQLAVVGSRNPTPYGRDVAFELARDLSGRFAITSGLAIGIDASAHRGALAGRGATLAVCGTGLDVVYPARHRSLATDIVAHGGALISEFPLATPPRRPHFPRRNRLLSGLSLGTIVVEATLNSGSLITADCAVEQNRDVFAVPGSIHSPLSAGCHHLIQQGAKLVRSSADIMDEAAPAAGPAPAPPGGDALEARILAAMGFAAVPPDLLVRRTGLTPGQVSSILLRMEVRGTISHCPGGGYIRVQAK